MADPDRSGNHWISHSDYRHAEPQSPVTLSKFHEVTDLLLSNPNLNSSHLFRADVLYNSAEKLPRTGEQLSASHQNGRVDRTGQAAEHHAAQEYALQLLTTLASNDGTKQPQPHRKVVRRLIPRNQNLDNPLEQTCLFYTTDNQAEVVVYVPHVGNDDQIPWYHPKVRALAYVYEPASDNKHSTLSLHVLPYTLHKTDGLPQRLDRTLLALLNTFVRLSRHDGGGKPSIEHDVASPKDGTDLDLRPSAIKDTIIPQATVQDAYARLKSTYATNLIAAWVEATPPEKHVFEDLSIAAFLVCLWTNMYGSPSNFPGFVDLACGNGLLVHILLQEGWQGYGLDARRRKTWTSLNLDNHIQEKIIIPQPFLDKLDFTTDSNGELHLNDSNHTKIHNGILPPGTFIIANHADELTIWTPLLSALSNPENPLLYLNIPCCSHALSGSKHRYTPKDTLLAVPSTSGQSQEDTNTEPKIETDGLNDTEPQPARGDLRALRAQRSPATGEDKSMYACLTRKAVQIARQLGVQVGCTLMRIPSTRNIGVVNMSSSAVVSVGSSGVDGNAGRGSDEEVAEWRKKRIDEIIARECVRSGGVQRAAEVWVERARKVHSGGGRGKVNLGGPREK